MKLYKTTYNLDHLGADGKYATKSIWHASADAASKHRTALKETLTKPKPVTEAVDVPTDKTGLLGFLNGQ